jgi:hypothetical protein
VATRAIGVRAFAEIVGVAVRATFPIIDDFRLIGYLLNLGFRLYQHLNDARNLNFRSRHVDTDFDDAGDLYLRPCHFYDTSDLNWFCFRAGTKNQRHAKQKSYNDE